MGAALVVRGTGGGPETILTQMPKAIKLPVDPASQLRPRTVCWTWRNPQAARKKKEKLEGKFFNNDFPITAAAANPIIPLLAPAFGVRYLIMQKLRVREEGGGGTYRSCFSIFAGNLQQGSLVSLVGSEQQVQLSGLCVHRQPTDEQGSNLRGKRGEHFD